VFFYESITDINSPWYITMEKNAMVYNFENLNSLVRITFLKISSESLMSAYYFFKVLAF
jgi:hypothetical protein